MGRIPARQALHAACVGTMYFMQPAPACRAACPSAADIPKRYLLLLRLGGHHSSERANAAPRCDACGDKRRAEELPLAAQGIRKLAYGKPRPISALGTKTVVRGGVQKLAESSPSNPMTETSCGTEKPRSERARMAPTAMRSESARNAVGIAGSVLSHPSMSTRASSVRARICTTGRSVQSMPASTSAPIASSPQTIGMEARLAGKIAYSSVSPLEEIAHCLIGRCLGICSYCIEGRSIAPSFGQDKPVRIGIEQAEIALRHLGSIDDGSIGRVGEELFDLPGSHLMACPGRWSRSRHQVPAPMPGSACPRRPRDRNRPGRSPVCHGGR